jgi:hypothetical protein
MLKKVIKAMEEKLEKQGMKSIKDKSEKFYVGAPKAPKQ